MEVKMLITEHISKTTVPLSQRTQMKIASLFQYAALEKGEFFLKEGEICKHIGYVHKGMVRMFYYKNKKELTESFAYEQKFFLSTESCFKKIPSPFIIEALEPTVVYSLPFDEFIAFTREEEEAANLYRLLMESALIRSQNRIDSFRFETAKERYFRLIKDDPEIVKRAPLSYIASYLLMTPETLSRVRANIL